MYRIKMVGLWSRGLWFLASCYQIFFVILSFIYTEESLAVGAHLCLFSPCHISYKGHLSSGSTDMSAWLHEHRAEPSVSPECNKSHCGSHHCYYRSDEQL